MWGSRPEPVLDTFAFEVRLDTGCCQLGAEGREDEPTTRPKYPRELGESQRKVGQVFADEGAEDGVKSARPHGQHAVEIRLNQRHPGQTTSGQGACHASGRARPPIVSFFVYTCTYNRPSSRASGSAGDSTNVPAAPRRPGPASGWMTGSYLDDNSLHDWKKGNVKPDGIAR